ncbi:phage tail terminator-like protein [Rhizobium leguminosarum]|uniref:phage tail terminator-like protein n=1 Tax=Rhizobium leguminosarum TaxID=384 RepID=UPI001C93C6FB|nr:phage tail terminator-like protein [Rhizobium leguminosarum]MBY5465286.1 hypothetical protein [Rhizobium leguminosarum]
MADTPEKSIFQALLIQMKTLPLPSGMTLATNVVLPGVQFTPQATTKYVSFEVHFNTSIRTDLSLQIEPIRQGFIRGNVLWPKTSAQVDAVDLAGVICALFAAGTKLMQNGRQTRFDQDPEVGVVVTGDSHFTVPVTAFWQSYPLIPA